MRKQEEEDYQDWESHLHIVSRLFDLFIVRYPNQYVTNSNQSLNQNQVNRVQLSTFHRAAAFTAETAHRGAFR
jgi:hypothetical protein